MIFFLVFVVFVEDNIFFLLLVQKQKKYETYVVPQQYDVTNIVFQYNYGGATRIDPIQVITSSVHCNKNET
jgi:hypothetical protein